jgi:hypothetical protein
MRLRLPLSLVLHWSRLPLQEHKVQDEKWPTFPSGISTVRSQECCFSTMYLGSGWQANKFVWRSQAWTQAHWRSLSPKDETHPSMTDHQLRLHFYLHLQMDQR